MEDEALLLSHVRVRATRVRLFIEVRQESAMEDTLTTRWLATAALPVTATAIQVRRAQLMALADYRHFRVCDLCGVKRPAGEMQPFEGETDVYPDCRG